MKTVHFPSANKTLGIDQEGVLPIHAYVGLTDQKTPITITCWEPSDSERVRIAAGEPIFVMLQTFQPPPQLLVIGSPFTEPEFIRRPELDRNRKIERFSEVLGIDVVETEKEEAWEETATGIIHHKTP